MENMTQSQKSYIYNVKLDDSYKFYNKNDDGTVRLLHKDNMKTLTVSLDDLKFFLDNELINVSGLNMIMAGHLDIVENATHRINKSKLEQFKQAIENELEEQRQEKIRQIQEQHEAERIRDLQQKASERNTIFKAVIGIMNDFKRDNRHKEFKSDTIQKHTEHEQNTSQQVNSENNTSSQYAQSMNNPNLDSSIR